MFDQKNMNVVHHKKEDKIKPQFLFREQRQPRFLTQDDLIQLNPDATHLPNLPLFVETENLTLGNVS